MNTTVATLVLLLPTTTSLAINCSTSVLALARTSGLSTTHQRCLDRSPSPATPSADKSASPLPSTDGPTALRYVIYLQYLFTIFIYDHHWHVFRSRETLCRAWLLPSPALLMPLNAAKLFKACSTPTQTSSTTLLESLDLRTSSLVSLPLLVTRPTSCARACRCQTRSPSSPDSWLLFPTLAHSLRFTMSLLSTRATTTWWFFRQVALFGHRATLCPMVETAVALPDANWSLAPTVTLHLSSTASSSGAPTLQALESPWLSSTRLLGSRSRTALATLFGILPKTNSCRMQLVDPVHT